LAREFARRILEAAHVDQVDDVMLVASELVTNAVLHASTHLELVIDVGTTSCVSRSPTAAPSPPSSRRRPRTKAAGD
jgi:hypothetical protein